MKTMMMFERLVSLHRERHRQLRLDVSKVDFSFAAETNSVPLTVGELSHAAMDYPCVFIESNGKHALCALLGLGQNSNLFVDAQGRWTPGAYVPAFFRRYPFALAETDQPDNFLICVDEACPGLGTDGGEPLFEVQPGAADGASLAEGRILAEARQFLLVLHQEFAGSNCFCDLVAAQGLLDERAVHYTRPDGTTGQLTGFKVVNEDRLRALPPALAAEWLANGYLGVLFAHLLSLGKVEALSRANAARAAASPTPSAPVSTAAAAAPGDDPTSQTPASAKRSNKARQAETTQR